MQPVRDRTARHPLHRDRDQMRPRRRRGDRVAAIDDLAADGEIESQELTRQEAELALGVLANRKVLTSCVFADLAADQGHPRPRSIPADRPIEAPRHRSATPQMRREALDVPAAEFLHQPFGIGRVGAGLVARTSARPAWARPTRALSWALVADPHLAETLSGRSRGPRPRPCGPAIWCAPGCGPASGNGREGDDVVAHEMVPGIRLGPDRQAAQPPIGEAAEQLASTPTLVSRSAIRRRRRAAAARCDSRSPVVEMLDLRRREARRLFPLRLHLGDQRLVAAGLPAFPRRHRIGREAEAVFEQRDGQLRMVARAVIALAVILHRQLPVALLDQVDLAATLVLGRSCGRYRGDRRGQRRRNRRAPSRPGRRTAARPASGYAPASARGRSGRNPPPMCSANISSPSRL
jgi:hypothetical protein